MLRFQDVTFRYAGEETPALQGVSFTVPEGAFAVLLGRSGSGKSTILRLLKPEVRPSGILSGSVEALGRAVEDIPAAESASRIAIVRQDPEEQIVTDRVWRELAFGAESLGWPSDRIRRRVAEISDYFRIEKWFRRETAGLSGGEKQILNLAAVMVTDPDVLLLDEPTARLDPGAAEDFLTFVRRINREFGVTVLMAEHRTGLVLDDADQVLFLGRGALLSAGSPRDVVSQLGDSSASVRDLMPEVWKIFRAAGGSGEPPISVAEGRRWVRGLLGNRGANPAEASGGVRASSSGAESARRSADAEERPVSDGAAAAPGSAVRTAAGPSEVRRTAPASAVRTKDVAFRYEPPRGSGETVLRDVTMDVPAGSLYAVLGGNGAGKTTLLRVLAGLERPVHGRVSLSGRAALLPQDPKSLLGEITVTDELIDALETERISDPEKAARVDRALDRFGLTELADRNPYDLSGGETEKLAIAKLLLTDPDILLLDEPTKGLDVHFRRELARMLRSAAASGKTVIFTSHDMSFCAENADLCAMLFDGEVVTEEPPSEFFSGNRFYTTSANLVVRNYFPDAVTWEEAARCLTDAKAK